MYFPTPEEQRYLQQGLLPEIRRQPVAEELRGWRWPQPPVAPVYAAPLGVYEVAGKYCPTGRDVYLRRVERVRPEPTPGLREGRALHALAASLVTEAKRLIYQHGSVSVPHLARLQEQRLPGTDDDWHAEEDDQLAAKARALRAFEVRRITQRVEEVLAKHPSVGADALAALALPVSVEVKLNGRFLGLSEHLSTDAVLLPERTVLDLKFGPREPFHRLTTTGYALALESLLDVPVDVGCIVYARFSNGRVLVERDYHAIGDELRQEFLEEREEKMRLIADEVDPGVPAICPQSCPFLKHCRPEAAKRPGSANSAAEPAVEHTSAA